MPVRCVTEFTTVGTVAALVLGLGCGPDTVIAEGELGRAIALASGDASSLPRLAFIDEGCPGSEAVGGCPAAGDRMCAPVLVDSLAPLTTLPYRDADSIDPSFSRECIELRSAAGLADDPVTEAALAGAVTRFRFHDVPLVRAASVGTPQWSWTAGDETIAIEPGAVLGGNVLREHAVVFRSPRIGTSPPSLTFYGEFPGTESDLADDGFAYIPLQFPGRLLGRTDGDECEIGADNCSIEGFDLQGRGNSALVATRMVIDACVSVPPCGVSYAVPPQNPFAVGECRRSADMSGEFACDSANDTVGGGKPATLIVATGVAGIALFEDSARRMFGALAELPTCDAVDPRSLACQVGGDGGVFVSGWPPAGSPERPLFHLRVRSVALVPGLTRPRGLGACDRVARRSSALLGQCGAFVQAFAEAGDIELTSPPYTSDGAEDALVVLGEAQWPLGADAPDPERWLDVRVIPADHPLVLALRRDVAPEAIQPDGLLGTALLDDTLTVLDYTDANPGLRVACLDPRSGDCAVAPECRDDAQSACCFGLPLPLLTEFILLRGDETCCAALSAQELREIQDLGVCGSTTAL